MELVAMENETRGLVVFGFLGKDEIVEKKERSSYKMEVVSSNDGKCSIMVIFHEKDVQSSAFSMG